MRRNDQKVFIWNISSKKFGIIRSRFENCADATENDIDRADGIEPKGFYMQMFTAQFGVWLSWATW